MSLLREQLEILEKDLSNEKIAISPYHDLPFAIFRYDPDLEFEMRKEIKLLETRLTNKGKNIVSISLANLFYDSISKEGGFEKLINEEIEFKFQKAQESLNTILSDPDYSPISLLLEQILDKIEKKNTIVFLHRAGIFAPNAYRISVLLDYMKGKTEIPCILFYPGLIKDNELYFMGIFNQPPGSYHVNIYNK